MTFLARIFRTEERNPARALAMLGVAKRRQTAAEQRALMLAKARAIRAYRGLPPSPALEPHR